MTAGTVVPGQGTGQFSPASCLSRGQWSFSLSSASGERGPVISVGQWRWRPKDMKAVISSLQMIELENSGKSDGLPQGINSKNSTDAV